MYQRPVRFNLLPEVIKNLLIINGLFFLATIVLRQEDMRNLNVYLDLVKLLGLYLPGSKNFEPYQIITHLFMHGNFGHIFLNMFALWMFGYSLENVWGPRKFLIFYLITGLGAALVHTGVTYWETMNLKNELLQMNYFAPELQSYVEDGNIPPNRYSRTLERYLWKYDTPTVGASGAVFGVLLAFGMMFPNQPIYIYFLLPIKAKYFVIIYGVLELYNGIAHDRDGNIAHFAHLGGMLFGYLLIKYWRNNDSSIYH